MRNVFLTFVACLLGTTFVAAQSVGINASGAAPAASSILDVSSTTKGMLVPRMTLAQRGAIVGPVTGLLIYQTDGAAGFWYYDGTVWNRMGNGNGTVTSVGTTAPLSGGTITTTGTISISQAGTSSDGYLSSTDWNTFNNKVGGSGAATRVAFWSGTSTLSSNANLYWDNTNSRLGIGTAAPGFGLEVYSAAGQGSARIASAAGYAYLFVDRPNTGQNGFIGFRNAGIDNWVFGQYSNANYRIIDWTNGGNGNNAFVIEQGAPNEVGINTAAPNAQLEIGGNPARAIRTAYLDIMGANGTSGDRSYFRGLGDHFVLCTENVGTGTAYLVYPGDLAVGSTTTTRLQETVFISATGSGGNGNVGVGTGAPAYKLDAVSALGRTISGVNTVASSDLVGVYGETNTTPYWGYGTRGVGGYMGVRGDATLSGTGTRYGVYGYAAGGTTNYAMYSAGNFTCSGTKAATVRTPEGPKELYSQESPELWFEDFGSATIQNGIAVVALASDYSQTVTVDASHPMHAFLTPNGDMGNWWVEYSGTTFIVHAPNAGNGTSFDYRVVAKRKGFEDLRLKKVDAAYGDHFLYPNIEDVPMEHRGEWTKQDVNTSTPTPAQTEEQLTAKIAKGRASEPTKEDTGKAKAAAPQSQPSNMSAPAPAPADTK